MTDFRVGTGFDAHAFEQGVPLVLGGVQIDHPRGMAGHSDGDVLAHALTDAVLGAAGMEDIGALFPSGDPALEGADSLELLRVAWQHVRDAGWELANADVVLIGEEPRLAPHRDAMRARLADALGVDAQRVAVRATTTDGLGFTGRRRGPRSAGRRATPAMKLRIITHAEKDLRDTMPHMWPAFMDHDPIVSTFWPRLYDVYADFQLWVLDGKETVANACTLPVSWDGLAEPRGLDWAMTNGAAGAPTTLCAVVVNIVPSHRGTGLSGALLRRMSSLAAAHGLDSLIAPVRPTWKEHYPLTPIERYVALAAGGRAPVRPMAPDARANRRVDSRSGAALDDDHRVTRGVGGVDGPAVPRRRRLHRAACARAGALRERGRHVRRAERVDEAPALFGLRAERTESGR